MNSHVQDLLSPYLDGELSPHERSMVEAHLAACTACSTQLEEFAAVDEAVRALPLAAPAGYFEELPGRVRARLAEQARSAAAHASPPAVLPFPRRRSGGLPAWTWALAAALVLGVLTPLSLQRLPRRAPADLPAAEPPAAPGPAEVPPAAPVAKPAQPSVQPELKDAVDYDRQQAREYRQPTRAKLDERDSGSGAAARPSTDEAERQAGGVAHDRLGRLAAAPADTAAPSAVGDAPLVAVPKGESARPEYGLEYEGRFAQSPAAPAAPRPDAAAGGSAARPQAVDEPAGALSTADGLDDREKRARRTAPAEPRAVAEEAARAANADTHTKAAREVGLTAKQGRRSEPDGEFSALQGRTAVSLDEIYGLRDDWRAFAARNPAGARGDDARWQVVRLGYAAWKQSGDQQDLDAFVRDARTYLARPDSAYTQQVRQWLATLPTPRP